MGSSWDLGQLRSAWLIKRLALKAQMRSTHTETACKCSGALGGLVTAQAQLYTPQTSAV